MTKPPSNKGSASKSFTPLKLSVSRAKISAGCYKLVVTNAAPKTETYLCLGSDGVKIDISKGYSKSDLSGLLKVVEANSLWAKQVKAYAISSKNGKVIPESKSKTVAMHLPVEPYKGTLSLEAIGKDKNLTYTGIKDGRLLHTKKINGWHLIKFNGFAETEASKRGLNCITYVGGAFGKEKGMNGYGTKLAKALGATKCGMECKFKDDILKFFEENGKTGQYIMWDEKHVVVVKNGVVMEFAKSKNGFSKRAVKSWGFSSRPYWIRKL